MKAPRPLGKSPKGRDKCWYCDYHKEHNHSNNRCRDLMAKIEELIQKGYLRRFRAREEGGGGREVLQLRQDPGQKEKDRDDSQHQRRRHSSPGREVGSHQRAFKVERVLVDNGSSTDIMFWEVFQRMELEEKYLRPVTTPLYGFIGSLVQPKGMIELQIRVGLGELQKSVMANFSVVDIPSAYNIILGRPSLNNLKAVVSTFHLKMKFPMERGVRGCRGDQLESRRCYVNTLKETKKLKDIFVLEVDD
ncbi:uncharacterized protein LOC122069545 [Macadamia integrifolia]|uniref:uncharacterized protein LOC122069545 n=1 Tax=Macadamia integrifolia TaxID=60698 RepID=UPI001C4F8823|nr:uncharacterized protein LOC122069545 [Macadamia integrifolia]